MLTVPWVILVIVMELRPVFTVPGTQRMNESTSGVGQYTKDKPPGSVPLPEVDVRLAPEGPEQKESHCPVCDQQPRHRSYFSRETWSSLA